MNPCWTHMGGPCIYRLLHFGAFCEGIWISMKGRVSVSGPIVGDALDLRDFRGARNTVAK